MRTNVAATVLAPRTHEGAIAKRTGQYQSLRRSVLSCMLWESSFYEDGQSVADRIRANVASCKPQQVADLAVEARTKFKLRHVPLLLVREMLRHDTHRPLVADTLSEVIQRPDELTEFLSIYFQDQGTSKRNNGKGSPLPAQVKKGLARAFQKFNEYSLAKYNQANAIKLRDVLFLTHAKPRDAAQADLWRRLVKRQLTTPDTWEVELSASSDKTSSWTRLLRENKLGALALLKNLRNMLEADVALPDIQDALRGCNVDRVLPFRFISAAKYAPRLEADLEQLMFRSLAGMPKLSGKTVLLVDHSGSMNEKLSSRSEMTRFEAAAALAMLIREVCETCEIVAFSAPVPKEYHGALNCGKKVDIAKPPIAIVPSRRGFALRDAIDNAVVWGGTNTEDGKKFCDKLGYDRLILLTDEQSHQTVSNPIGRGYCINVSVEKNGIGYGKWIHVDGFSEAILDFIQEFENPSFDQLMT